jgi:hypothetical protein
LTSANFSTLFLTTTPNKMFGLSQKETAKLPTLTAEAREEATANPDRH